MEAAGYVVVGEAASGEAALTLAADVQPDIVILDVQLPGLDGVEVARRLVSYPDAPAVVLVSSRDATSYGARLSALPVRGFVTKSMLTGDVLDMLVR